MPLWLIRSTSVTLLSAPFSEKKKNAQRTSSEIQKFKALVVAETDFGQTDFGQKNRTFGQHRSLAKPTFHTENNITQKSKIARTSASDGVVPSAPEWPRRSSNEDTNALAAAQARRHPLLNIQDWRARVRNGFGMERESAEAGLFRAYTLSGGPIAAGNFAFLGRGSCAFVTGILEVKLLVAGAPTGCIVFPKVMRLINTVPCVLSTFLFLQCYSFVGVPNLLLMFLRVFGVKGLMSLGAMLC